MHAADVERDRKALKIFGETRSFSTPESREEYVNKVCSGDELLRARVEVLLANNVDDGFLQCPATILSDVDFRFTPREELGDRVGRYRLLQNIGEGGCGSVYMAEQQEPIRRHVALKVIKLGMDTRRVVARFEAERQALAMMDHPNIAKVLDAGATETGRPYFVMELLRGVPITEYCDKNRVSTLERIELFITICEAIQHAHQKGIIHRDLKPSNVMVTVQDGMPVPKVIDFGIAKATGQRLTDYSFFTQHAALIGTPAYMSPEQAEMGKLDIDTRTDIYSLGVLLYELLTGRTPFDFKELTASGVDGMRKVIRELEPFPPSTKLTTLEAEELYAVARSRSIDPSKLAALLRGDLDWIVIKCLEKDRSRRYETVSGLAADLRRHIRHEPVVARPPTTAYRLQKAIRRNKLAFTAGTSVFLALLLGLGISLWQYAGKSRAEREQNALRAEAEARAAEAREARAIADEQRDLAQRRLYHALVNEARSIRKARQLGFRREAFDRLKQAAALGIPGEDQFVLRREAAVCLGDWIGLEPVDILGLENPWAAAVSADGTITAISEANGHVQLADARTGRPVAKLSAGGFAPSMGFGDGSSLYVTTVEYRGPGERPKPLEVQKWSMRGNGSWVKDWGRTATGPTRIESTDAGLVTLVLNSSHWIATDIENEIEFGRAPSKGEPPRVPVASISRDRKQLAFFSLEAPDRLDVQVELWDLQADKSLGVVKPRLGPGWRLSFAPDATSLAATYDNMMTLCNLPGLSGKFTIGGAFDNSSGAVSGGLGDLIALPSMQEAAVRLISHRSGVEVARIKVPSPPRAAAFNKDGSVLVITHGQGSRVVRLDIQNEKMVLNGHVGGVPAAVFSRTGKELASIGKDRTLRIWDLEEAGRYRFVSQNLPVPGQTLTYLPEGAFLLTGYYNTRELGIWSSETGEHLATLKGSGIDGTSWSCAVSPNGKYLASIGAGLNVWDLQAVLRMPAATVSSTPPILSVASGVACVGFHPSGTRLAYVHPVRDDLIGDRARTMALSSIDLADTSRSPLLLATNLQVNYVQAHCFLPKSGALAYITSARNVAVIDCSDARLLREFPTPVSNDQVHSTLANICASPDESKLAVVSLSGTGVDLLDPQTGKVLYSLPEATSPVWWLAWSPESDRLAVTRASGEIAIWNVSAVEKEIAMLGFEP